MAFDQTTRNRLQRFVADARSLLTVEFTRQMQNEYGIDPATGNVSPIETLHLDDSRLETARILRDTLDHYRKGSVASDDKQLLEQIVREQAFTVLNRFAALKMAEARGILIQSLDEGYESQGFQLYQNVAGSGLGETGEAYKAYLFSIFDEFAVDLKVLFDRFSPTGLLFPKETVMLELLALVNDPEIDPLWSEDETIGWIYQYFNTKEERKKMRDESAAPRNSRELAVRNQFFTPRYVVEFLTDNTLGRTWYEMTRCETSLAETCRYLVRRPNEVFLDQDENSPELDNEQSENLSQEELLNQTVYIPHRPLKDPREILMLDPACGSMHFGLYAFDLFLTIYEEAWDLLEPGAIATGSLSNPAPLREAYENDKEQFLLDVPRLIIENNIHGVDIDPRAVQIAGLSLWLRAQRAWAEQGVKPRDRPQIRRSNIVCAEPMPGEADLLEEFIAKYFADTAEKLLLGEFVRRIFASMKLAGEAGSLLKIEEEVANLISESREQWKNLQENEDEKPVLFDYAPVNPQQSLDFQVGEITDANFWNRAESEIYNALRRYSEAGKNGADYGRRLFADDAAQGFAFIDLCKKKYDFVLMNPPFGDASIPSKPYIDETFGDTKGDVYKAFVECFQDRLVPAGLLGIISSRTGFFLSGSADWRERIVLRLYRPLLLADFGMGVLDAMVETAAYVLRSLTEKENHELTLQLLPELAKVQTDKNDVFSTKKYQDSRGLKRFQATAELNRLQNADFIAYVEGSFPRWTPLHGVIAKAQIPSPSPFPWLVCFRLLGENDKGKALDEIFANEDDSRIFVTNPDDFRQIPNTPFGYWISKSVRQLFKKFPALESDKQRVLVGLQTDDDFRFIRNWFEVRSNLVGQSIEDTTNGKVWMHILKGGDASAFYSDVATVVNWHNNGQIVKEWITIALSGGHWSRHAFNTEWYGHEGLSWAVRTSKFKPSLVPNGCIPTVSRYLLAPQNQHWELLALLNSLLITHILRINGEWYERPKFIVGIVQRLPLPEWQDNVGKPLRELAEQSYKIKRGLDTANETSHVFQLPALLQVDVTSGVSRGVDLWQERVDESEQQLHQNQNQIEDIVFRLYGISDEERQTIVQSAVGGSQSAEGETEDGDEEIENISVDRKPLMSNLVAYALGVVFGRWDVLFTAREKSAFELPDPFAPLPVCSPGMLQNDKGLPAGPEEVRSGYPVEIAWNGVVVDDAGNSNDIEIRLNKVLQVICKTRADAIEAEACEILGVRNLRDYFRKPSGFFADHLKRYSKSRRQAPIYLPLSTKSGEYTLWLYYHRLTDQTLFSCINDFVEPKIRQVKDDVSGLSSKLARSSDDEKRLEQLSDLSFELEELRDELLRLAPIWKPNLNDGVQITMSPLWKLFRLPKWRKTLEDTWDKLEKGDHDWAHLAYSLYPERVREKCKKDKSLAIAHDLEDLYEEPPSTKAKKRKKPEANENTLGLE